MNRRDFLKATGAALIGMAAAPALKALASETITKQQYSINPETLSGTRWAMVIDPTKCKHDCTKCIDACHTVHNVPRIEGRKEEVKWIWKEHFKHAFPSQYHENVAGKFKGIEMLVMCNHCDNPPCVRVCPTKATFRRNTDGIVMMDYHRCIGCRYCIAACPYGSRSFNWRDPKLFIEQPNPEYPTRTKGVVEKCNFCAERLAKGMIPACVEACPEKALLFGDIADPDSEVSKLLKDRYAIIRKPELGTRPQVYYLIS